MEFVLPPFLLEAGGEKALGFADGGGSACVFCGMTMRERWTCDTPPPQHLSPFSKLRGAHPLVDDSFLFPLPFGVGNPFFVFRGFQTPPPLLYPTCPLYFTRSYGYVQWD